MHKIINPPPQHTPIFAWLSPRINQISAENEHNDAGDGVEQAQIVFANSFQFFHLDVEKIHCQSDQEHRRNKNQVVKH